MAHIRHSTCKSEILERNKTRGCLRDLLLHRALRAAVNIGSWSKRVLEQCLLGHARLGFNRWDGNDRRDMHISLRSVIKHYKSLSKSETSLLRSFYR